MGRRPISSRRLRSASWSKAISTSAKLCNCKPEDQFSCYQFPRVVPGPDATALQLVDRTLDCAERRRRMSESSRNTTPMREPERSVVPPVVAAEQADTQIARGPTSRPTGYARRGHARAAKLRLNERTSSARVRTPVAARARASNIATAAARSPSA